MTANAAECQGRVTGQVTDEEGAPIEGASIFIVDDIANQNVIASAITGHDGSFAIEGLCGNRVLGISCLGYEMARYDVTLNDKETLDLGKCQLKASVQELQTVIVKGQPVRVKSMADGFSVNVSSIAASSNNALDLLGRLPQIAVKGNEIKVVGKEQIILWVNNVQQRVSEDQLADVLRGYDASLIKSVDVITSPPLKYDAEGTSAMIVLHMDSKFNKYSGGNIGTELMKGSRYNGRYGIYGSGVFNNDKLFVDITPSYNHNYSFMSENSTYFFDDGDSYINDTPSRGKFDYYGSYATVQYQYNSKGYVGLNCNINKRSTDNEFTSTETWYDETTFNHNAININRPRINASAYAEHSFSRRFKGWIEAAYYNYKEDTDLSFDGNDGLSQDPFMTYFSTQNLKMRGVTFSNDYSLMFDADNKYNLDFGIRAYYASTRNKRYEEQFATDEPSYNQDDYIKVKEFKLNPYISTTLRPIASLYFRLGVQLSYTDRKVHNQDMHGYPIEYTNFLPDFIASWTHGGGSRLSFIITSGCIEPKFSQINPFEWRMNQYSYAKGNLDLESESRYNYKLVYTYKGNLSISCSINRKENEIVSVNYLDGDKVYSIMENAQNTTEYVIKPSYYFDRLSWMELSAEAYWGYGVSKGLIPGVAKKATTSLWGGNLYTGFVFNKQRTFTGYVSFDYTGKQKNAISEIDPMVNLGACLSLYLLDRRLAISLAGLDLFASSYKGTSVRDGYSIKFNNKYNYPTVYFSVSYKFNNLKDSTPRRQKMMQSIDRRM